MEDIEPHPYISELFENIKWVYGDKGWEFELYPHRSEILIILPEGNDAEKEESKLYAVLEALPEIDHPRERVRIVFWLETEPRYNYKISVINPNHIDESIYALGPGSYLNKQQYEDYLKRNNK